MNKQICLCECHQDVLPSGALSENECCELEHQKYIDKAGNVDIQRLANLRTKLVIADEAKINLD